MKEKTKDDWGFSFLIIMAIIGTGVTIAGGIILMLNTLAIIGFFLVDVIR